MHGCSCGRFRGRFPGVQSNPFYNFFPFCLALGSFKVMLHETIRNDDFKRNTALQHCCDIFSNSYNIVPTLQRWVALKIVLANRPVYHHLYLLILRLIKGDGTRDDSQRRFLAQYSVAMLEQCCKHSKQCRNSVAMLCCNFVFR